MSTMSFTVFELTCLFQDHILDHHISERIFSMIPDIPKIETVAKLEYGILHDTYSDGTIEANADTPEY